MARSRFKAKIPYAVHTVILLAGKAARIPALPLRADDIPEPIERERSAFRIPDAFAFV